jgi:site-specific DNA-methyltransferase (adenine-specific)
MDRLILLTTDEGDIVLDPFSGTGTTAVAAKRLGRQFVGFELDKKYVEISEHKLNHTLPNFRIGNNWVSFYLNDIVTIKDKDWPDLSQYFSIPNPLRNIDFEKVELIDKKWIPENVYFFESKEKSMNNASPTATTIKESTKYKDNSENKSTHIDILSKPAIAK